MKEKLITFTRNKENKTKLIIAEVAIFIIFMAIKLFGIYEKLNIAVRLITVLFVLLMILGVSFISKFFDVDERIIRHNRIPTIIMAYTDIVGELLVIFFLIITPTYILNIPTIIMLIIAAVICYTVSKRVNEEFRTKIKIK